MTIEDKKGNIRFSIGHFLFLPMASAKNWRQLDSKANLFIIISFKTNWNITAIKHEYFTGLIAFQKQILLKYNWKRSHELRDVNLLNFIV